MTARRHRLSRRAVLGSLAAALLAARGTAPARARGPGAPVGPHFTPAHRYRPLDLLPTAFVQHDTGARTTAPAHQLAPAGPAAPFATVVVDIAALAPGATVTCGLQNTAGDRALRVRHHAHTPAGGTLSIEVTTPAATTTTARATVRLQAPCRLAFTVTGRTVTAFAAPGTPGMPWRPLLTDQGAAAALLDPRRPDLLNTLRYAHRGTGATIRRVRAGHFGQLGLRDLHLVRTAEGEPYTREGRVFLTAGCAGAGFSQQAHTGVFAMDPAHPDRLEAVAKLFFTREGLLFGDHGGQIVYDGARERFIVVTVGGDLPAPGVRPYHLSTRADLLRGVHVLRDRPLDVPFTRSAWDPALIRDRGRWLWAYVDVTDHEKLTFGPVLAAAAPGGDYADALTRLPAQAGPPQTEGCRWQHLDGRPHLLVSDRARAAYPLLDRHLRPRGTLDAPYPSGTPFPQVFPVPGTAHDWLLVTFDESPYEQRVLPYGTHGEVVTMRARGGFRP
ncbi:hypothetical protein GPA10_28185 [Streptomyces sp. p1417]|uniref:Uncharacterized protein n=1 Tax=Streptomyces typhae TaxID=2681492 RepID=A0A6L6X491_9ACTN|nr:hypothetical protein [Streptomyces typhae]MVO88537.1 hypothetical protein [Streptomyces typhae]